MFWVGLALRLLYLTAAHTYRFRAFQDHFQFGWEMGRIARALATGFGYADPFEGHTGPTAWTPPLYPLLMATAFKLFGVYTAAAGWCVLAVNSLFSAATAPALYEIGDRCYGSRHDGRQVPLWAGWLWALYPAAMQYAVRWPWEMAITTCLFTWALVLGLRLRGVGGSAPPMGGPGTKDAVTGGAEVDGFEPGHAGSREARRMWPWALFGLFWGAIALLNSSLLLFLPVQVLWILWPARRTPLPVLQRAVAAGLVFLACITPWTLRNARVFHALVPLRDNFGAELYMSALPSHDGFPWGTSLPIAHNDPELRRYARMGELAYSRMQGVRGKALIAADPDRFLRQVLFRIQFYWAGVPHPYDHGPLNEFLRQLDYSLLSVCGLLGLALSLYRRVPGAGLFAAAFGILPLVYYGITVQARFRAPLEPLIALFSVFLFHSADRRRLWSFSRLPR